MNVFVPALVPQGVQNKAPAPLNPGWMNAAPPFWKPMSVTVPPLHA